MADLSEAELARLDALCAATDCSDPAAWARLSDERVAALSLLLVAYRASEAEVWSTIEFADRMRSQTCATHDLADYKHAELVCLVCKLAATRAVVDGLVSALVGIVGTSCPDHCKDRDHKRARAALTAAAQWRG